MQLLFTVYSLLYFSCVRPHTMVVYRTQYALRCVSYLHPPLTPAATRASLQLPTVVDFWVGVCQPSAALMQSHRHHGGAL